MKFLLASSLFVMSYSLSAAVTNPQDCLKQKKALDRRYCMDTYLEAAKEKYDADKKSMAKGISDKDKAAKTAALEQEIAGLKDYQNLLKSEIEMKEKFLEEVKGAKAAAAPKKEEKKKKKKDKGFRIKL